MKKALLFLLCLELICFNGAVSSALAQESQDDLIKSTQNDIILVGAAGIGGAILGLSTLSFVEKPSQHLSNIWTGAALGVIAGVLLVAYNSAQKGSEDLQSSKEFNSSERAQWHALNTQNLTFPSVQFGTQIWQTNF